MNQSFQTIQWKDGRLIILDQRKLPTQVEYVHLKDAQNVWLAIRNLMVRGANAIGITAAYGLYLGTRNTKAKTREQLIQNLNHVSDYLKTSRPTAVHMFWAINRVREKVENYQPESMHQSSPATMVEQLLNVILVEAQEIQEEDIACCRAIGEHGVSLMHSDMGVLTHCNAGALGTSQYGTALAPMYIAQERGFHIRVFADETRPVLQGARLTTWELAQAGIDVTLICDNMAASVMKKGWIDIVFVGADRIAANGDTANKIGTYGVAVFAKEHGIPFYVAAPIATFDIETPTGNKIPIEERPKEEVTEGLGRTIAPDGIKVYNPAFDVTPSEFIAGIITERGIIRAPFKENIQKLMMA